jgi:hypothetical protein
MVAPLPVLVTFTLDSGSYLSRLLGTREYALMRTHRAAPFNVIAILCDLYLECA